MSPVSTIRNWLSGEPAMYECRNCGTTVAGPDSTCPACDADDIATFEL